MRFPLRRIGRPRSQGALSQSERRSWDRYGYLVLPGFFDGAALTRLNQELDDLWASREHDDRGLVVDLAIGTADEARRPLREAPDEARSAPYKLNDTYLVSSVFRDAFLDRRLTAKLGELLGGEPIVGNSLNFERGSQQRFHFDTFYMPPSVPGKMLACWIALEDCDSTAGPLRYYPGSHLIPPYLFSDGRPNARVDEMGDFDEYIDKQIADKGLVWESFPARAGDVFVWHAHLYHGGAPIEDLDKTRRSAVGHYFRVQDVPADLVREVGPRQFMIHRDTQPHRD